MGWDTSELIEAGSFLRSQYSFSHPRYYLFTYSMEQILPVFYGIWRFITWSTWASHWILFWTTLFQFTISHLVFYVHFNVASSTLRSRKWSLSFQFSDWNFDLIFLKCFMQITNCEAPHYAAAACYFLCLRSVYCPWHPTGRHPHWHITKWLLPCVYRQHIGPVFVKCHFPVEELDILPLKFWPLCCLLSLDIYHHVMWCDVMCHIPEKLSSQMDCGRSQISHTFSLFVYFSLIWEMKFLICGKKQPEFDSNGIIVVYFTV